MCVCTLVVVLCQVLLVDVEVVVSVQLPELAVDDVEMFVGEELCQLVHVLFLLQQRQILGQRKEKSWGRNFNVTGQLPCLVLTFSSWRSCTYNRVYVGVLKLNLRPF